MPSKLPRINFVISQDEYEAVLKYKEQKNIKNLSQAYISLIQSGLAKMSGMDDEAPKKEQPAAVGELSASEEKFFTALRAVPDEQRSLALSLCTVLVKELVRHQKAELKKEAPSPVEINR